MSALSFCIRGESMIVIWVCNVEFSDVLAPEIARLGPQEQAFAKEHYFTAVL